MGDLSKNFSRFEWTCKCGCGEDTVDAELVRVLQDDLRDYYKAPVTVTPNGGCRCPTHNIDCGGSDESQHMQGKAADVKVKGVSPQAVFTYLNRKFPNRYGLGNYRTFTHLDVRKGKARWTG